MSILTHLAFYPTLAYNMVRHAAAGDAWAWYSRVDDLIVIGALPFKKTAETVSERDERS